MNISKNKLTGISINQIEYATSIKSKILISFNDIINKYKNNIDIDIIKLICDKIINNFSASYWINHSDGFTEKYILSLVAENKVILYNDVEKELKLSAMRECIIIPDNSIINTPVEFKIKDDLLIASLNNFNEVAHNILKKECYFVWDSGKWELKLNKYKGDVNDRIIEAANKLLLGGIPVLLWDFDNRKRAIVGDYKPLNCIWIDFDYDTQKFKIWWFKNSNNYKKVRKLNGKYHKGEYSLSLAEWEELKDFSNDIDVGITEDAIFVIKYMEKNLIKTHNITKKIFTNESKNENFIDETINNLSE